MIDTGYILSMLKEQEYSPYTSVLVYMSYAVAPKARDGHLPVIIIVNNMARILDCDNELPFYEQLIRNTYNVPREEDAILDFLYVILTPEKVKLKTKNAIFINPENGYVRYNHINGVLQPEVDLITSILDYVRSRNLLWRDKHIGNVNRYHPWLTFVLIALNVVIYLITRKDPAPYGYSVDRVLNGNFMGIFTYMFVHANLLHLISNMTSLYCIGSALEEQVGAAKVACLYLISGLYGSLIDIMIHALSGSKMITVGASGAICGLLTAFIVKLIMTPKRERTFRVSYLIKSVIMILFTGFIVKSTNNTAHIGGMIAGVMFMFVFGIADRLDYYKEKVRLLQITRKFEEKDE